MTRFAIKVSGKKVEINDEIITSKADLTIFSVNELLVIYNKILVDLGQNERCRFPTKMDALTRVWDRLSPLIN